MITVIEEFEELIDHGHEHFAWIERFIAIYLFHFVINVLA